MRRVAATIFSIWLALFTVADSTRADLPKAQEDEVYEIAGLDAPMSMVVDSFLHTMAAAYNDAEDMFAFFCEELGIDPSWPSAKEFAGAAARIERTYYASTQEVRRALDSQQRAAELNRLAVLERESNVGKEFGEIYVQLKRDGFELSLAKLLFMIDAKFRTDFTRYSSKPFNPDDLFEEETTFWEGVVEKASREEVGPFLFPKREGKLEPYFDAAREAVKGGQP